VHVCVCGLDQWEAVRPFERASQPASLGGPAASGTGPLPSPPPPVAHPSRLPHPPPPHTHRHALTQHVRAWWRSSAALPPVGPPNVSALTPGQVCIVGLSEQKVGSVDALLRLMEYGNSVRCGACRTHLTYTQNTPEYPLPPPPPSLRTHTHSGSPLPPHTPLPLCRTHLTYTHSRVSPAPTPPSLSTHANTTPPHVTPVPRSPVCSTVLPRC
jgi:hypothetical protein